jgi:murein DD-endopeptidase MepM/ murein hydrolase activator NlpD
VASNGNFVFSELNLGGRVLKIFRYTDKNGNSDFYNEKGESIRKALMKTPINGARITSGYGMRNHPISGYTKMHRGIDFGAPIGTPIYAAGDGVVQAASVRNGYGNYLKIKHNSQYSSAYAHLSRYASGIAPGKHVKQGQIVAYVGMTGAATGPHLHYEILVNNVQVNPANVKFKTGTVLQGKELVAFRENMNKIEARLASISRGNTVAMVDEEKRKITD